MRVGVKKQDFEQILNDKKLTLKEKKTGKYRSVIISNELLRELSNYLDAIEFIFEKNETLMCTKHPKNWARFINLCLKKKIITHNSI